MSGFIRIASVGITVVSVLVSIIGCTSPGGGDSPDSDNAGDGPQASPRPDGATLLFSPYETVNPDASAERRVLARDGTQVVFTLFLNGYNTGPAQLWIVNVDGSDAHRVTPAEDQDNVSVPGAAWNAATDEIVFASDREDGDDLWAIHPDGTGLRRITTHAAPPWWIEPVWSPDGEWIVFESDVEAASELEQRGTIYKVRSDGTEMTQLTKLEGEDYDDRLPNWSPDDDRILFQRRIPPADAWDVYVIDTDGGSLVNVSHAPEYFNTDNSWSPDGRWIASSSQYPVGGDELPLPNIVAFFVPDADSPENVAPPVRITVSDDYEDGAPSVSPDGRWVTFESHRADEESPSDLWIVSTPEALLPADDV